MEISNEKINIVKEKILNLWNYKPKSIHVGMYSDFRNDTRNPLSNDCNLDLVQSADRFDSYLTDDEFYEIVSEIRTNLINIPTDEACLRYLKFTLHDLRLMLENLEASIDYEYWSDPEMKAKIRSIEHLIGPERKYKQFLSDVEKTNNLGATGNHDYSVEQIETMSKLREDIANAADDPIHYLLRSYLYKYNAFVLIICCVEEFIEELAPNSDAEKSNPSDLSADRHRLILLNETGVFKVLVDKFLDPLDPKMSLEDFAKLISTMIGAKSKELRSDVGKLKAEITDPKILMKSKTNKTVQNRNSLKEVNTFLASLGIPIGNNM